MLGRLSHRLPIRRFLASCEIKSCRRFTTASLYSRLPTSVYRLQLFPKSNLSAYEEKDYSMYDCYNTYVEEQALVSSDGLVYPRISEEDPTSNGPRFLPNSLYMQELTRDAFDQYIEEDETRKPVVIGIKKGTLLPTSLIAFYRAPYQFSIQPLQPMELSKLNGALDELYATHATIWDATEWFDQNPYYKARQDPNTEEW